MFEDSLVESHVARLAPARRWTAIASITLQLSIAAILVTIPLLHPERLIPRVEAPPVILPLIPKPPVIQPRQIASATSSSLSSIPSSVPAAGRRFVFPTSNPTVSDAPPSTSPGTIGMGGDGIPDVLRTAGDGHGVRVSEVPSHPPASPLHVSTGVSTGLLIAPIRPVYPAIAKAAGVQGTVIVEAVISRTGTIESLRVISGPAMLCPAAMEAIQAARYQPYRLNGESIEVETTITVNFKLG
jgi:periplasmic protein TonB